MNIISYSIKKLCAITFHIDNQTNCSEKRNQENQLRRKLLISLAKIAGNQSNTQSTKKPDATSFMFMKDKRDKVNGDLIKLKCRHVFSLSIQLVASNLCCLTVYMICDGTQLFDGVTYYIHTFFVLRSFKFKSDNVSSMSKIAKCTC